MAYIHLMEIARRLERNLDTEYAENNPGEWEHFEKVLNEEYDAGNLTDEQFNELALTAFYDYPYDLKGENEQ